ncbi:hypothetical protein H072_4907 [Dactylellina haptotyla CBS 200.50]|uniref:SP-RING-type domain-containing protein n=1 Tax=Dactylellina haptotyla (strain CBS 200.50) TaxID=1284197 RepID=S8AJ61_DACHA|nr:hypothetical protein H072_4907 [Dactylellina haptotyla CBS 200.50]
MSGDTDPRWEQQRLALQKHVQSKLLVRNLQTILKKLALPVSGLKAAQQTRLIEQINTVVDTRNDEAFQRLKRLIFNPDAPDTHTSPTPSMNTAPPRPHHIPKPPNFSSPHFGSPGGVYHSPLLSPNPPSMTPGTSASPVSPAFSQLQLYYLEPMAKRKTTPSTASSSSLTFFPSPFYEVKSNLTSIHGLTAYGSNSTQSRSVVNIPLNVSSQNAEDIRSGYRTILYCAAIEPNGSTGGPHHVAFPQQIEIRVNGKAVSANLRGLKNKPGTTRPLDVTDYIDKNITFKNNIMITYALSAKRYLVVVKLIKKSTPEDLVNLIKGRPHISKQNVLDRLRKESEDDDIVATSSIMSLKCPASTLRIVTPIRCITCKHHQCYDAISFLQLQEQAPTWTCPVCSKRLEFEQLAVDKYVEEILNSVSKSVDAVMIDPMGKWTVPEKRESSPRIKRDHDSDDSDVDSEDELSILDTAPPSFRSSTNGFHPPAAPVNGHNGSFPRPNLLSTPKSLSSEPLAASSSRPNGGNSNKRPLPVTIDLTLSEDEDDELRPPPPKRHQTSATPTPSYTYAQRTQSNTPAGPFTLSWSNPGFDY